MEFGRTVGAVFVMSGFVRLGRFAAICRFFLLIPCIIPFAVSMNIWHYGVYNERFGLLTFFLRFLGFRVSGGFVAFYSVLVFTACCVLLLIFPFLLHSKKKSSLLQICVLLLLCTVIFAAMCQTILFSFSTTREIFMQHLPSALDFKNYRAVLQHGLKTALLNSFWYSLGASLVLTAVSIPIAAITAQFSEHVRKIVLFVCVIVFLSTFFVAPDFLASALFANSFSPFFLRLTNNRTGLILVYSVVYIPFSVVLCTLFRQKSDRKIQFLFLLCSACLVFVVVWNDRVVAALFSNGNAAFAPITVFLLDFSRKIKYTGNLPELFAALVLCSTVPIALCAPLLQIFYRRITMSEKSLFKLAPFESKKIWGYEHWIVSTIENAQSCTEQEKIPLAQKIGAAYPLLLKVIQANDTLSVQVHPADEYAHIHENSCGKTECWYILDAQKDSSLICGLSGDIDRQTLSHAIKNNALENYLYSVPVKRGDFVFIPAGTVHAIQGGLRILEIQQPSDVTYRLYDWGRGRELHVEKSLDVIENAIMSKHATASLPTRAFSGVFVCPYFTVEKFETGGSFELETGDEYTCFFIIDGAGSAKIENETVALCPEAVVMAAPHTMVFFSGGLSIMKAIPASAKLA